MADREISKNEYMQRVRQHKEGTNGVSGAAVKTASGEVAYKAHTTTYEDGHGGVKHTTTSHPKHGLKSVTEHHPAKGESRYYVKESTDTLEFSTWLNEAISDSNAEHAASLISSYLSKKTGHKFVRMAGVEEFSNSVSSGYGIRFFYDNDKAIRFNWGDTGMNSADLVSVDVWNGESHDPSWNLEFDHEASLVTILPFIADVLQGPIDIGEFIALPADNLNESDEDTFEKVLSLFKKDEAVPVAKVLADYGSRGEKILNQIRQTYPGMFEKQGRTLMFTGSTSDLESLKTDKDKILTAAGGIKVQVKKGGNNDTVDTPVPPGIPAKQAELEKVAYEDQLDDLKSLVTLTVKGASNALFVAGRGGVGKTFTVEEVLHKLGLRDGDGYFKQTGSASAAGIYRLLFQHRKELVLFDDADGALADQDGRNLIKAATDTKKVRKLAWAKNAKNLVDADEITDAQIEAGMLPTSYEFTGRIVFISNLSIDKLDPDRALRTRALMISIDPTDEEVVAFMRKIVDSIPIEDGLTLDNKDRVEVLDLIDQGGRSELNIRKLVRSLNIRASANAGGIASWQRLIKLYA